MEYKDNNTESQHKSKLVFEEQVIAKIVAMAIKGQEGITTVKSNGAFSGIVGRGNESSGINVEVGEAEVAVDLRLWLEFGKNARDIYLQLKDIIEEQVMSMTGLKVVEVNAKIEDVLSPDEFRDRLNG